MHVGQKSQLKMCKENSKIYLNPSVFAKPSSHLIRQMKLCQEWRRQPLRFTDDVVQSALTTLYSFVGAHKQDFFVSASSGINAVAYVYISAIVDQLSKNGRKHILTMPTAEFSPLFLGKRLKNLGIDQKKIPLHKNGIISLGSLKRAISPQTGLFSFSWANPYTGVIQPSCELVKLCREKGVLTHVDVSHILGKCHFNFAQTSIDYLTFNGAFLHGPQGSGGVFVSHKTEFEPLISNKTLEAEHYNAATLVGLGIAFKELKERGDSYYMEISRLRDILEREIQRALPNTKVLFKEVDRLPSISIIVFPGIANELLTFHLKESGVYAFFGGGRPQTLKDILITSGIDSLEANSAVSFSLSRDTTEKEIARSIEIIVGCAKQCRTYSAKVML